MFDDYDRGGDLGPVYVLDSDLLADAPTVIGSNPYTNDAESYAGVAGRINLGTAPEGVLQLLPLVIEGSGFTDEVDTEAAADPRSGGSDHPYDPFGIDESLAVDSCVTRVGTAPDEGLVNVTGADTLSDPTGLDGAITGYFDYDGSLGSLGSSIDVGYADVTRLSNLTTRRSDSYTVYVLLQAWENVDGSGTGQPRLVRQERTAFIVDRSGVRPTTASGSWSTSTNAVRELNDQLKVTPVPVRQ